ncbi:hypothetical protein BAUCODRAFT_573282 [Baudoinia panamericana UAMH 10762]|uniref:Peroxisomal membrane protein PEX17 n=1 Tax=Baudoinia panamericana (strain UAMH 10762) TaxID=717646 RepID=M2N4X0_BAUPA|nr:uncharacterized protein BAUCODRAFT_573282 [Baudoinia panamericana UAMH 10762]EMC99023.1 hypothetical protein BAUCODRAFT_573282 [Baudoinia panamericana UAMH 10762]
MSANRLLGTLLRSLQSYSEQQDTPRLLGTASSLLTTLNNPLNVTLLTSQLLSSPAVWADPQGLRTCTQCLSAFHSAAQTLTRHERALREQGTPPRSSEPLEATLSKDDWIRAVVSGADEHSPRWRHLIVIGGLLLGFDAVEDATLPRSARRTLEHGLIVAVNAALEDMTQDDELGQQTLTMVLNHCFPIIADYEKSTLDYDRLLPVLMRSTFHASEGLRSAYFLGTVDADVMAVSQTQFGWRERSPSFQRIQTALRSPLVASLGPLSRLIGHVVEHIRESWLLTAVLDDLEGFARTLYMQWRHIKLSEIDPSEEHVYLDTETLSTTTPALWRLLKSILFATVIIMRSILSRGLSENPFGGVTMAPKVAAQALHVLRYTYFITSRQSSATFPQYVFVQLTAIDILAAYPREALTFVQTIKPAELGRVPAHPVDRSLDLFFLGVAEHFTLLIPQHVAEEVFVASAAPYLTSGGNNNLLPIFEAAHSLMLATFSAPQNLDITVKGLPSYMSTLFAVFPHNLSTRQFRFAFKMLMQLATPPSQLAAMQPMLVTVMLELLHERALHASTMPLPQQRLVHDAKAPSDATADLSEQAVFILAIVDALPQLPLDLLDEWLPLAAVLVNRVVEPSMRMRCREHYWQVLISGEMDADRSQLCAAWWNTAGGREAVLNEDETSSQSILEMSGALPDTSSKQASKL